MSFKNSCSEGYIWQTDKAYKDSFTPPQRKAYLYQQRDCQASAPAGSFEHEAMLCSADH